MSMPWAIQRVHVVLDAHEVPSVLGQTVTRALRRTASALAVCNDDTSCSVCPLRRLLSIIAVMLGAAITARMPITAKVIINSTRVKPRLLPDFRHVVRRWNMVPPEFGIADLIGPGFGKATDPRWAARSPA